MPRARDRPLAGRMMPANSSIPTNSAPWVNLASLALSHKTIQPFVSQYERHDESHNGCVGRTSVPQARN